MNPDLTDADLDAMEARANAATEGPWKWGSEMDQWGDTGPNLETVERGPLYPDGSQGAAETVVGAWGHDAWGITVEDPDADFIAHAREDVPALIAEVRRLRALVDDIKAEAWAEGYGRGVADEFTSQDWTGGTVPPARPNPYRRGGGHE